MDAVNVDPHNPFPLPVPPFYEFGESNRDGREWWRLPEYERATTSNSGRVIWPASLAVRDHLLTHADDPASPARSECRKLVDELDAILAITPPDDLLADYRALRLRAFFERFLRSAIDALVSPDGSSNAARVLTSEGGFRKDSFSELSRVMIASLLSGKDSSIASAVRLYLEAVR